MLKKCLNDKISAEFLENDESILLTFEVHSFTVSFILEFSSSYPFSPPELKLLSSYGLDSLTDISRIDSALEYVLCETWLPVMSLNSVIEALYLYSMQSFKPVEKSLIIDVFQISKKFRLPLMLLLCLASRVLVINFHHMDWNKLPEFGPYESFRNMMEVTYNFQIDSWYGNGIVPEIQSPPLLVFLAWGLSFISKLIDPNSIELNTDPGYQSVEHKSFMRILVIIFESLIMITGIVKFFKVYYKNISFNVQLTACWLVLINPSILLIAHVFFSMCIVSYGLIIWAIYLIIVRRYYLSCLILSFSLGFSLDGLGEISVLLGIIATFVAEESFLKSKNIVEYKNIFIVSELVTGMMNIAICFIFPLIIISIPWLSSTPISTIFNPNLTSPLALSPFSKIFTTLPSQASLVLQLSLLLLFSLPILYYNTLQKCRLQRLFTTLYLFSLILYLFSPSSRQTSVLLASLLYSLTSVISTPYLFQLFSILSSFILYPQCMQDTSRMSYFICCLTFYTLTSLFIQTINYLSNRSNYPIKLFYLLLSFVHLTEVFDPALFLLLHQTCCFFSFAVFYLLVLMSSFKGLGGSKSHDFRERRFRSKSKNT